MALRALHQANKVTTTHFYDDVAERGSGYCNQQIFHFGKEQWVQMYITATTLASVAASTTAITITFTDAIHRPTGNVVAAAYLLEGANRHPCTAVFGTGGASIHLPAAPAAGTWHLDGIQLCFKSIHSS